MSVQLLTFTISSEGNGDRDRLRKALLDRGSKHLFETTHLLADEDVRVLSDFCTQYIDERTDHLLVINVTNPKWGWLKKDIWTWIDSHLHT